MQAPPRYQASDFPRVDRTLKGDRLVTAADRPLARDDHGWKTLGLQCVGRADAQDRATARRRRRRPCLARPELQAALNAPPLPQYDISLSLEAQPLDDLKEAPEPIAIEPAPSRDGFSVKTASLFFGSSSLGGSPEASKAGSPARSR